jgi:hypothetical protein
MATRRRRQWGEPLEQWSAPQVVRKLSLRATPGVTVASLNCCRWRQWASIGLSSSRWLDGGTEFEVGTQCSM